MVDQPGDPAQRRWSLLLMPLLVGAVLAVALGVFGRLHHPTGSVPWQGPFPDVYGMKVWLTLVVLILAAGQFITALWMYGKLGSRRPPWLGGAPHHRLGSVSSKPAGGRCVLVGVGL